MNWKVISLVLILSALILGGCGVQLDQTSRGENIQVVTIAEDRFLGDGPQDPAYFALKSQDDLEDARGKLPAKLFELVENVELQDREILLIAYAGVKNTSGYSIHITKATRVENTLRVTVVEESPGADEITEQVLTIPYHLASVSIDDQHPLEGMLVEFVDKGGEIIESTSLPEK